MNQYLLTSKIGMMLLLIATLLATAFLPPEILGEDQYITLPELNLPAPQHDSISNNSETVVLPPIEFNKNDDNVIIDNNVPTNSNVSFDHSPYWIVSSRHLDQNDMVAGLSQQLQYFQSANSDKLINVNHEQYLQSLNPNIPICIVIHGSFTSWQSVKSTSSQIVKWLSAASPTRPMQYIFYTWPSESAVPLIPRVQVLRLGRKASVNGFYLANHICELPGSSNITLIGHSHGARIASSTLHLLGKGSVEGMCISTKKDNQRLIRAVYLAAAIDHHWLNPGKRFDRAVHRADSILVLVNNKDWALSLYPLRRFFSNRALSNTGFTNRDRNELGHLTHKLYELDVTDKISKGHFLVNYIERPSIACSIAPFINFVTRKELHTFEPDINGEAHTAITSQ